MLRGALIVLVLISSSLCSQERFGEFRAQIAPLYEHVAVAGVDNFTCVISSTEYINFIKQHADSSYYYPLKLVWIRGGGFYYPIEAIPELSDSLHRQMLFQMQQLKNQATQVMADWESFGIYPYPAMVPAGAMMTTGGDTVIVSYQYETDLGQFSIESAFSAAGRLLQTEDNGPQRGFRTVPTFEEHRGRFVCVGWNSQEITSGEVAGGVAVRMELVNKYSYIVPSRIDIAIQRPEDENARWLTPIFLKDYQFNENIQFVNTEEDSTAASATDGN